MKVGRRLWWRRALSFEAVLIGLLIVLNVYTVRSRFADPDMWWHVRTGQLIWQTHSIPRVDPFSFTAAGKPWVAQEWLSQLTLFGAYVIGGYSGLMVWLCFFSSLILIASYGLCRWYSGDATVAFAGTTAIWFFSTVGLSARPHLLGYALLLCELLVLRAGRTQTARWYWALPLIFGVWINVHSSFFLGVLIAFAMLVLARFEFRMGSLVSYRMDRPQRRQLAWSLGVSLVALLANPVGIRLLFYPVDVMLHQPLNMGLIAEWQPASFADVRSWLLVAAAAFVLLAPLLIDVPLYLEELVLVTMGFFLAVQHSRMLFVFGILAMPVICRLSSEVLRRSEPRREHPIVNAVLIAVIAAAVLLGFPSARELQQQVNSQMPVRAVDFLRRSHATGRMLNEYVFGGYLIWAAPERPVFVDGRADLYEPAGVLAEYSRWQLFKEDPRHLLDQYGIRICLLSRSDPMVNVLPLVPGWKRAYGDDVAVVFVRD